MAFLVGFPNQEAYVLEAPILNAALDPADLSNGEYLGLPVGSMVLTADYNSTGDGALIMKALNNVNQDQTDWVLVSTGTGVGAAL